ncbi:YceI family protein [Alterisphingorhabdus coralli]|uniref:YceI family protein n=1 Tax=Alterisphingorhabdus coralli TaxID=3071408 RepID=A0AA97F4R6_9SPHN|nr:YceI family protein [Parasphingorhabdus sp. SCSIO 66989]WOE74309.1 YceI family protein [Parasphingorhabdus sp. SCSIO 66989]
MKKALILASLIVATPLIAQSAPQVPGAVDASRVTGGTYATDPGHTLIGWRVSHFGFNDYFGIFGDATGTLTMTPDNLTGAKVDITIPVAKVTTASEGLTEHLLRPGKDGGPADFFGPEPSDARFVSTEVAVDGTTAKITGDLTLNGVTKPVTLDTTFTGAGTHPFNQKETVGFEATTTLKRSDFGINYAIPFVSDEVELDISVAFEKQ